jgi:hypothetical protein
MLMDPAETVKILRDEDRERILSEVRNRNEKYARWRGTKW